MEQQNEKRICRIGDRASLVKTFTEKDLQDFAVMTMDDNGMHVDAAMSRKGIFRRPVVRFECSDANPSFTTENGHLLLKEDMSKCRASWQRSLMYIHAKQKSSRSALKILGSLAKKH